MVTDKTLILSLLSLLIAPLHAISLSEYTSIVLRDSNEVLNLVDSEVYARFNVESVLNRYDLKASPDSTLFMGDESHRVQLGLQGSKKNLYGGEVYTNVYGSSRQYTGQETEYGSEVRVGYRQSLWQKFGKDYNTLALFTAKERLDIQKILNDEQRQSIIIEAVRSYYAVQLNKKKISIQEKSLQRSKVYYEAAEAKQQSGLVSKIDVYRAKISYLDQKRSLSTFIKQYEDALEAAVFLIDQDKEHYDIAFDDEIEEFSYTMGAVDEEAVLASNAFWLDLESREDIMAKRFVNTKKELYPDLVLDASYRRFSHDDKAIDALHWNESDWGITLRADYQFDKFAQEQQLRILQIEKGRLRRDKRQLKHAIFKEIREVESSYRTLKDALEIESMKSQQAKESLEVAKIRYERGLSENLDLIDAENAYLNAQISYYSTLVSVNLAILRYLDGINLLDVETVMELQIP